MIKMLVDGRDRSFKILGNENILKYLDYPLNMDIEDAADKLEEENDGMDFYHIEDADVNDILSMSNKDIVAYIENAKAWDEYGVIEAMGALCKWFSIPTHDDNGDWRNSDEILADIKEHVI